LYFSEGRNEKSGHGDDSNPDGEEMKRVIAVVGLVLVLSAAGLAADKKKEDGLGNLDRDYRHLERRVH
jgi:hypothetical protein